MQTYKTGGRSFGRFSFRRRFCGSESVSRFAIKNSSRPQTRLIYVVVRGCLAGWNMKYIWIQLTYAESKEKRNGDIFFYQVSVCG